MSSDDAMEFLMTYGWAILVVLVAVGSLAYFGVLSPDHFVPFNPETRVCTEINKDLCVTDYCTNRDPSEVVEPALCQTHRARTRCELDPSEKGCICESDVCISLEQYKRISAGCTAIIEYLAMTGQTISDCEDKIRTIYFYQKVREATIHDLSCEQLKAEVRKYTSGSNHDKFLMEFIERCSKC